jgi:hypothetical protein
MSIKNQLSRQTGSRNPTGPKMLPTIWYTYMTLVTKYQISGINSYWEKCDEKYLGWTEGQTDRDKTVYPPPPSGSGGITIEVHVINHSPCNPASTPEREHSITVNIRDTICIERGSTTCDFGVVTGKWNTKVNIIYRKKNQQHPFRLEITRWQKVWR